MCICNVTLNNDSENVLYIGISDEMKLFNENKTYVNVSNMQSL